MTLPSHLDCRAAVSPRQYEAVGNWLDFQRKPAGTGPFKVEKVTPRVSIDLVRNADYWDKARIPKVERMVLMPIPDANTRVAALRSGQVDWIEFPAPESLASLKAAGFKIVLKPYPHIWTWHANNSEVSALSDKRVRIALNYAIDRNSMVELLAGTAVPAVGIFQAGTPYFGYPKERYTYDIAKAKALLKEAGYGPDKPLKVKIQLPTAGSGNMVPLPMGELIQQNLRDVNVMVDYAVVDWGTMLQTMRQIPNKPGAPVLDAINHGLPMGDPTNFFNNFASAGFPPNGSNWSFYKSEKVDSLLAKAFASFDKAEQTKLISEAHAEVVDDAAWLFVVHDLNPRAMSPKVKGFVQAQSWYQDFTQVTVEP